MRLRLVLPAAVAAALLAPPAVPPAAAYRATELCTFQDPQITESSGVAASSERDHVLWTHNDSGDDARVFAVRTTDCATVLTVTLRNPDGTPFRPNDVEDMAKGPSPGGRGRSLWLGDVGNNNNDPTMVMRVHRLAEPALPRKSTTVGAVLSLAPPHWESYELAYPDGGHDSETLLAHPLTGRLYVVTKTYTGHAGVYAAPPLDAMTTTAPNPLVKVADVVIPPTGTVATTDYVIPVVGALATTGGDISPDGRRVVVRTYTDAFEWAIPGATEADFVAAFGRVVAPAHVALPPTFQGEAIGYTRDGRSLWTTSESTAGDQFGRPARPGPVHRLDP